MDRMRTWRQYCFNAAFILFLLLLLPLSGCSPDTPPAFLNDRANLLTVEEREHLVAYNRALLEDLDIHFKLVILDRESPDINTEAAEIFGDLGKETRAAKGLLFLVDPYGEQVRIEVGYDMEPVFPDLFVGYLESRSRTQRDSGKEFRPEARTARPQPLLRRRRCQDRNRDRNRDAGKRADSTQGQLPAGQNA